MIRRSVVHALLLLAATIVLTAIPLASRADEPTEDEKAAKAPRVERVYDVHDMLWGAAPAGSPDPEVRTYGYYVKELTDLIADNVAPKTWKQNGGADTISERDARLAITSSEENHRLIAEMFRQLRETLDLQGTTLLTQFVIADEEFVRAYAPAVLGDKPQATAIGALTAREITQAVRASPGAKFMPGQPMPLHYNVTSYAVGSDVSARLPGLGDLAGRQVEVRRPGGVTVSLTGVEFRGYVTLDLDIRAASFDARDGGATDEIAAAYRDTITLEQGGRFLLGAPLVRARLAGVRDVVGADGVTRREVVREDAPAAEQSEPRRYLLVLGAVRGMTDDEIADLAGLEGVSSLRNRYGRPDPLPAAQGPRPPGAPPAPPPPPPDPRDAVKGFSRLYDVRGLFLGPEPEAERAAARAKRIERVLKEVEAVMPKDKHTRLREHAGRLFCTGTEATQNAVIAVIDRLIAEQVLKRK